MNPETNKFEPLSTDLEGRLLRPNGEHFPAHWVMFSEEELVVLKGRTFKVAHIGESYMILEPVSVILNPTPPP